MLIEINRTGKKLILERTRDTKNEPGADSIAAAYGYRKIDALDWRRI